MEFFDDGELQLYHLGDDIGETDNRINNDSLKAKELYDDLRRWRQSVNAPVPSNVNPAYVESDD